MVVVIAMGDTGVEQELDRFTVIELQNALLNSLSGLIDTDYWSYSRVPYSSIIDKRISGQWISGSDTQSQSSDTQDF